MRISTFFVAALIFADLWVLCPIFESGLYSPALAESAPSQNLDAIRARAEQGDANAQFNLGWEYWLGGEKVRQDYDEAVKWWHKAAEQGDAKAQYTLGLRYERGLRVPRDYAEALKLFRSASNQGLAQAQFQLGLMYHEGEGVTRDDTEAVKWWREADRLEDVEPGVPAILYCCSQ
jgi:TPR repeat protein